MHTGNFMSQLDIFSAATFESDCGKCKKSAAITRFAVPHNDLQIGFFWVDICVIEEAETEISPPTLASESDAATFAVPFKSCYNH